MTSSSTPSGLQAFITFLETALECELCNEEEKELRTLTCCWKLVCLSCLNKLYEDETAKQLHNGTPVCPFCQRALDKEAAEYPVQKMVKHIQSWLHEFKQTLNEEVKDICSIDGCTREVGKFCKGCKKFFCDECVTETTCSMRDEGHIVTGVEESQQALHSWMTAKENDIRDLECKKKEVVKKVQEVSQRLLDSAELSLSEEVALAISSLTQQQTEFNQLHNKLQAEQSNLHFIKDKLSGVSEVGTFYIARQLQEYDECRKVLFGKRETIWTGHQCYDAVWSGKRHVVVGKTGGVEVIDVSEMQDKGPVVVKSIRLDGDAFSLQVHEGNIIVGFKPTTSPMLHTVIITLDSDYEEIGRWAKDLTVCDFAVADEKVVLSSSLFGSGLKRFTLAGEPLPNIFFNGRTAGIVGMSSATVALADNQYNKVYRKQVHENRSNILWSADILEPFAMCVDADERLWITSSCHDKINIVSSHGEKLQELTNAEYASLEGRTGIMVHDNYFYACHEDGIDRFSFSYYED